MAIATDLSISAAGVIDYIGAAHGATGAGYYTVLELHRWAGDLMDDSQATGDDILDITSVTASERSTDNIVTLKAPYTITAALAEHLYDGSIIQDADGTIWDGLVVIAAEGMDLQIQQNGAMVAGGFWNSVPFGLSTKGLNRDTGNGISHRFMIKVNKAGVEIDGRRLIGQTRVTGKTFSEFKINGTARGNNVLALTFAADLNDTTDASSRGAITNVEGYQLLDIDGDTVTEPYHSQWNIAGFTSKQFYERMKWLSRQGSASTLHGLTGEVFRGVTHEVGLTTPRTGTFNAVEAVSWGNALATVVITGTAGQFSCTSTTIVAGQTVRISGTFGGTGTITGYTNPSTYLVSATNGTTTFTLTQLNGTALVTTAGTPTGVSYTLNTGSGQMFAINSATTGTKMWIQLLTGVAPAASVVITGGTSAATCTNSGAPTERTITTPFCGVSTGSALIASYGFGIEVTDVTASDLLRDLDNAVHQPPNNVTFFVGGIVSTEDQVLVGPANGTALRNDQFTLNAGITAGATTLTVKLGTETPGTGTASATDTPTAGTLRVLADNGIYFKVAFTGRSQGAGTMTFTGCTNTPTAAINNNVYVSYIDALYDGTTSTDRFTVVFSANRSLYVRVRDGKASPIKTFESTGVLGSGGGSTTAIRTADA